MEDDDWAVVRPLIVAEFGLGNNQSTKTTLNIEWCKHQMSVFERSRQSNKMAALERGIEEDWTGKPYMLAYPSLRVGIRAL